MKKSILTFLLVAALCNTQAQTVKTEEPKPIADETFMLPGKSNFKVTSSNEKVTKLVLEKFRSILLRYNVSFKKDRYGRYAQYSLYFKNEFQDQVTAFLKSL